jgi:pyruvate dehydrogenase E2 component (dihydrolipoamide acetyltransferase)
VKAEIIIPHVGETTTRVKILQWFKAEGDQVSQGEPLLEVETDKSVLTIEAYADGVLDAIVVTAGEDADAMQVVGLLSGADSGLEVERAAAPSRPQAEVPEDRPVGQTPPHRAPAPSPKGRRRPISPLARKLAAKNSIDLTQVEGTGQGGMITADDVRQALGTSERADALSATGQPVELSRMRQTIGRRMLRSKTTIPHFYIAAQVDMSEAAKLRNEVLPGIERETGTRLSYTHMMVRALGLAAAQFPTVNATYQQDKLIQHAEVNVGIAVALDDGLIVPVLQNAAQKGLAQIAAEATALVQRARQSRLTAEDVQGGTITLTNLGGTDVELFAAIINPPECVIVASGEIAPRPVAVDDKVVVHPTVKLVASGDHRVLDGSTLARFLKAMKELLEHPWQLVPGN